MARYRVIWYGFDRARHAVEVYASAPHIAIASVLRAHREAMSAYIAQG